MPGRRGAAGTRRRASAASTRSSARSSSGPSSGETNIAASPIIFTTRAGGRSRSVASAASRSATLPICASSASSDSSVQPTMSAKQTVTCALTGGDVRAVGHLVPELVHELQAEDVGERQLHQVGERACEPCPAARRRLGRVRAQERLADQEPRRLGDARQRLPQDARHLDHALGRDAGVEKLLDPLRSLEVALAEGDLVGIGGRAGRAPATAAAGGRRRARSSRRPGACCSAAPRGARARPGGTSAGPPRRPCAGPRARRRPRAARAGSRSAPPRSLPSSPSSSPSACQSGSLMRA